MSFDPRLLRLALSSRFSLALTILFGFTGGILTVLQAHLFSEVIGQVFLRGQSTHQVADLLGILLGAILLRSALAWGGEVSAKAVALRVKTSLRSRLYEHILALGPNYARGERTGELVNAANEGVEALDAYFSQYLPQLVLAALVPVTFLVLIFPLDPLSAAVLLLTAPLIPVFMILIGNMAEALTRRQWQSLSRLSAYFLDVLQGLTTLKTLGLSRAQSKVIAQAGNSYRQITMGVLRVTFLSALVLELISALSTAVVAVEIGLRLLYGRLSFEQALFVLLLAPEFYLPLRMLGARFHAGMAGVSAAKRIFEILETREEKAGQGQPATAATGDRPSIVFRPSPVAAPIRFDNIQYTYPDGRSALKGVSFEILPGQRAALVGPSGSGKSTIAALLLRFIEPDSGQIRIDGSSLQNIPPEIWREKIAWVPQNPYLFHDTLEANIRLARPQASLEEVIEAARLASIHEFIEGLPQGYDSMVGERGARLSGGQAQRIALARAFLKNAPLLILDEPTANLDPELEGDVQDTVDRLAASRTVLTIAHRMNTVAQAGLILVLKQGRIIEAGTHAELAMQEGIYRQLMRDFRSERYSTPKRRSLSQPSPTGARELSKTAALFSLAAPILCPPAEYYLAAPLPPSEVFARSSPAPFSTLWRLLKLVAPYKGQIVLSVLFGFATIGSSIGLMTTSAYIIARAALQPSIAELQVAIVGVRFFGIARGLFRYLERYTSHQVTFHLLTRLRTWFYAALEPLAPARLLSYQAGDLLSRAIGDIASLENFYVRALAPPLVAVMVAVLVAAYMAAYSPSLSVSLLVLLLLAGAAVPMLAYFLNWKAGRQLLLERAALSAALVDGIQGLADLLAFGQGRRQLEKIDGISQRLTRIQAHLARTGGLNSALGILLASLGMWTIVTLAIPLVRSGEIDGVMLSVLALAALASFEPVLPLPAAAQYMEENLESARRLFELADSEPEVREPVEPLVLPGWQKEQRLETPRQVGRMVSKGHPYDLEIRRLSFNYPEKPPFSPSSPSGVFCNRSSGPLPPCSPALHDLTLSLPYGKRLGIVGPSGAGKSTLLNLLLRFWEYTEGEILLGGQEIRRYPPEDVRKNMAVVSQNTYLFNATVRENLLLARPEAAEAEIIWAAQRAQVHEFILSLPHGYDTWIGEQGLRLSGGERQRLAIARALLKDAPILILDEPTANLDSQTEREVLSALLPVMDGCTTLMITHRLSGLEAMDEIVVLRQGRIVERGRHADLLEDGGDYRSMWELQNMVIEDLIAAKGNQA